VSFSINDRQRGKFNVAVAFAGALEVKKKFESEATSNRSVFPPKNLTTLFETLAEYMAEVDMGVIDTLKGMQQSLVSDERARIEKLIQFVKEEGMSVCFYYKIEELFSVTYKIYLQTVIVGIVPSTVLPRLFNF
jgi:hypothetical protein